MLIRPHIDAVVRTALEEDAGAGDITTNLLLEGSAGPPCLGTLHAKEDLVLAGVEVARRVFELLDPDIEFRPLASDGDMVPAGGTFAEVRGGAALLLMGERTALNFLARLSGIAPQVARYREAMGASKAKLLATRKTTPGLRALENYAVAVGGGTIHRTDLYDGILIKDNHAAVAGSVAEAVRRLRERAAPTRCLETEARDLDELEQAIQAGADVVLLDNFSVEGLREAVARAAGRVRLEASGGVTLENVGEIAATGVDAVSSGAITHSVRSVDISMDLRILEETGER